MKITVPISQRYYDLLVPIKHLELCLAPSKQLVNMLLCVKEVVGLLLGKVVGWWPGNKT